MRLVFSKNSLKILTGFEIFIAKYLMFEKFGLS
jgi:hypothetical protein